MSTATSRALVYAALDSERDYQEMRRGRDGDTTLTTLDGKYPDHTPEEYLLYMEHYMHLARETASTVWGPACKPATMEIIRKVTALGVACMEANGAPLREMPAVTATDNR